MSGPDRRSKIIFMAGVAGIVLMVAMGVTLIQHIGSYHCARDGMIFRLGEGCKIDPARIILQRDLQRV